MSRYSGNNFKEGKYILCQLRYTYDTYALIYGQTRRSLGPPTCLAVSKTEVKIKGLKSHSVWKQPNSNINLLCILTWSENRIDLSCRPRVMMEISGH